MLNFDYVDPRKIMFFESKSSSDEQLTSAFLLMCSQPYLGKNSQTLNSVDLGILRAIEEKEVSSISEYYESNKEIFDTLDSLRWEFYQGSTEDSRKIDYSKDYIFIPEVKLTDGKNYPISANSKCGKVASSIKMLISQGKIDTSIPKDKFLKILNLLSTSLYKDKGFTEIISRKTNKSYTRDIFRIIAKWAEGLLTDKSPIGYNFYSDFLSDKETSAFYKSKTPASKVLGLAKIDIPTLTIQKLISKSDDIQDAISKISEKLPSMDSESPENFGIDGKLRSTSSIDIGTGMEQGSTQDYDPLSGEKDSTNSAGVAPTKFDSYWEATDDREDLIQNQVSSFQSITESDFNSFISEYKEAIRLNVSDLTKLKSLKTNLDKEFQGRELHSLLTDIDELVDFNLALSGSHLDAISILLKIIPSIKLNKSFLVRASYSETPKESPQSEADLDFTGETTIQNKELGSLEFDDQVQESISESSQSKILYLFIRGTDMREEIVPVYDVITGTSPISYFDMSTSKPYSVKLSDIQELHAIESYEISNNLTGGTEPFILIRSFNQGK